MTPRRLAGAVLAVRFVVTVFLLMRLSEPATALHGADKRYRIGWLSLPATAGPRATFSEAMRDLGYVEGRNMVFEVRTADGQLERLPRLVTDFSRLKVDVIVAVAPAAIRAAKHGTATIPIVMAFWGGPDLVESGIVASFARPGSNVTGVHMLAVALDAKRLELLLGAVPKAKRVSILTHGGASFEPQLSEIRKVAETIGLHLRLSDVSPTDPGYDQAFEAMAQARTEGLLVPTSPQFARDRRQIIALAAKHRIPAIYDGSAAAAQDGGLMGYGASLAEMDRRAAVFVDRILRGAKPGDLPIEQPTKFEFAINLRTARALGLTIPPALLLRADHIVE
jgi:putative ABC transport system substrate-binding protein